MGPSAAMIAMLASVKRIFVIFISGTASRLKGRSMKANTFWDTVTLAIFICVRTTRPEVQAHQPPVFQASIAFAYLACFANIRIKYSSTPRR
jgi:hypothetical protein